MAQKVAEFVLGIVSNPYIATVLIAMLPVIETKGSIPVAIHLFGLSWTESVVYSLLGGMAVTVLLVLFLQPVIDALARTKTFARLAAGIEKRFKKKSVKLEQKSLERAQGSGSKPKDFWRFWGIAALVSVPLPGTGVWGGTAIALMSGMRGESAVLAVTIGNFAAAIILTAVSLLF